MGTRFAGMVKKDVVELRAFYLESLGMWGWEGFAKPEGV